LLCISRRIFEKLCLSAQEFYAQPAAVNNAPARVQRTESLPKAPALPLLCNEEAGYSAYTPTPIWQTRYSELWQWQRVSEWHREYGQDEIINEKRHILV
jgi:hypothetical protein